MDSATTSRTAHPSRSAACRRCPGRTRVGRGLTSRHCPWILLATPACTICSRRTLPLARTKAATVPPCPIAGPDHIGVLWRGKNRWGLAGHRHRHHFPGIDVEALRQRGVGVAVVVLQVLQLVCVYLLDRVVDAQSDPWCGGRAQRPLQLVQQPLQAGRAPRPRRAGALDDQRPVLGVTGRWWCPGGSCRRRQASAKAQPRGTGPPAVPAGPM